MMGYEASKEFWRQSNQMVVCNTPKGSNADERVQEESNKQSFNCVCRSKVGSFLEVLVFEEVPRPYTFWSLHVLETFHKKNSSKKHKMSVQGRRSTYLFEIIHHSSL